MSYPHKAVSEAFRLEQPVGAAAEPYRHARARARQEPARWLAAVNETCTNTYDPGTQPFHANGLIYRKVEPRNTPTAINAVFNHRQFWDGRANSQFNGIDPFGPRTFYPQAEPGGAGNPDAARVGTLVAASLLRTGGIGLVLQKRLIDNASLASQAVGPPLSDFEMSCGGKTFADLGRKLLPLQALAVQQRVDPMDSLFSKTPWLVGTKGLTLTYRQLIEKAFAPKFWANPKKVTCWPAVQSSRPPPASPRWSRTSRCSGASRSRSTKAF